MLQSFCDTNRVCFSVTVSVLRERRRRVMKSESVYVMSSEAAAEQASCQLLQA